MPVTSPNLPRDDLGFLDGAPAPVGPAQASDPADLLPQAVADALLRLPGVSGAWIEREADGARVVVLYVDRDGPHAGLPTSVEGLPTRIVGGAPIRAL